MAFASPEDIQARLMRQLSDAEIAGAELLLQGAQAEIELAAGRAEANMGDPVPPVLRFLAIAVVCRELANPGGAESVSETLGSYSYRVGHRATSGTLLTDQEELMVRRAVHGSNSGTAELESMISDTCVLCGLAPSLCALYGCPCGGS